MGSGYIAWIRLPGFGFARNRKPVRHFELPTRTPGWRNWQTQRTQNPPPSLAYEFDSRSRHHYNQQLRAKLPKRKPVKHSNPPTLASHGGSTPSRHQHKTFKFNKLV